MKNYLTKLHYAKSLSVKDGLVSSLLVVPSAFYSSVVSLRNWLYEARVLKSYSVNAFVVSIGNLTTGGTGKTPVVCALAEYLSRVEGKKVAVISRGYGGKLSNKQINVVSDGNQVFYSAEMAGDEPYLMARSLKGVAVVTSKDRVAAAEYAVKHFGAEIIVLDDGYQYRRLKRDFNVCLVDGFKLFGNQRVLPGGPLREDTSGVQRADAVLVAYKNTNVAAQESSDFVENVCSKYGKQVCTSFINPAGPFKSYDFDEPSGKVFYAFTGIGQPESFYESLAGLGLKVLKTRTFADHHPYSESDLVDMLEEAAAFGANALITTEKDSVKVLEVLSALAKQDKKYDKIPVYEIKLKLVIEDLIKELIEKYEKDFSNKV